jgi:hypothetical protein
MEAIATLNASIQSNRKNLKEFPKGLAYDTSMDVLPKSGLSVAKIKFTSTGVIGSIRAGKKATIVKINLKDDEDWDCAKGSRNSFWGKQLEAHCDSLENFIRHIYGDEFYKSWYDATVQIPEPYTPETPAEDLTSAQTTQCVWGEVAGYVLYWRMTGQIYMDAMEDETNELKMLVLAKQAQLAYQYSEIALAVLDIAESCVATVVSI